MIEKSQKTPVSPDERPADPAAGGKALPPAARRALEEAEMRREARATQPALPPETGGRDGPEPTRYGDWEKDGIASDF